MSHHVCGFFYLENGTNSRGGQTLRKKYIPQVSLSCHARIVSTVVRASLTQTFVNPSTSAIPELRYAFPLYDGVSVVGFTCTVNKDRVIRGVVQEKQKAHQTYDEAVARGETAGLLEQAPEASDVFATTIGNVPPDAEIKVDITYLGELKHDAQVDGTRFTLPTSIAPRYGSYPGELVASTTNVSPDKGITIVVDVEMPADCLIKSVQSPSHPISVTIGSLSTSANDAAPSLQLASSSLSLGSVQLDKDFVLQVVATNTSNPVAILETHPTIQNQRALMATLVPKFNLPSSRPEIVFVCDRSGSMGGGRKIPNLKAALQVFLKSLPVGVKFNICSFGSHHSYLFPDGSKTYDQTSLDTAMRYVKAFDANFGGTEIANPLQDTFERRYKDMDLEVFVLTDGEVWNQQGLFDMVNKNVAESNGSIRLFTLGVGNDVSHALVEGLARAGNGFSQAVSEDEKMDSKVVRMLKGALTPHITDYSLEVKYGKAASDLDGDDFEVVEKVLDTLSLDINYNEDQEMTSEGPSAEPKSPISLFDPSADPDVEARDDGDRYSHLPTVPVPKLLQAPSHIPPLFPFSRTSVYLLFSPETTQRIPSCVVLRGTSIHGPLKLEIPVTTLTTPDSTIHQLAARKAVKELEEGRGWISQAKDKNATLLKDKYEGRFPDMVEREAVRLGLQLQVAGKWCSFVAVEDNKQSDKETEQRAVNIIQARQAPSHIPSQHPLPVSPAPRGYQAGRTRFSSQAFGALGSAAPRALMSRAAQPAPATFGSISQPRTYDQMVEDSVGAYQPAAMFARSVNATTSSSVPKKKRAAAAQLGYSSRAKTSRPTRNRTPQSRSSEEESDDGSASDDESDSQTDPLQNIVTLQTFSGHWQWSEQLLELMEVDGKDVTDKLQAVVPGSSEDVMATVAVISFLRKKLQQEKDAWEMMVDKAVVWLEGELGEFPKTLAEAADELFG